MKIVSSTAQALRSGASASAIGRALTSFRREEDGNMTIFSMYLLLMMLMVGGLGVDYMRLESERVGLQGAIDRSVLAAADLDQTLDQRAVIVDMLEKEGQKHRVPDENIILPGDAGAPNVGSGGGYAKVSGTVVLDTLLMRLVGIDQVASNATAVARESALHYEVSLVLDISGSMDDNASPPNQSGRDEGGRIGAMRDAATAFVETAIPDTQLASDQAITSISIIPYNAQVVLPYEFFNAVGIQETHEYSHCASFQGDHFDTLAIDTDNLPKQYAHIDQRNRNNNSYQDHPDYNNAERQIRRVRCFRTEYPEGPDGPRVVPNPMVVHETDATVLTDIIDTYNADGATGIDQAAKWGFALLDPSLRYAVEGNAGGVADGRPYDYDNSFSQKVLVLMTDGKMNHQPTWNSEIQAEVDAGLKSNVFYNDDNDATSVLLSGCKESDGVTDRPAAQCINRIVETDDNNQPFDETEDWWYWVDGGGYLPWPDTPYARVVYDYLDDPDADQFDQDKLEDIMSGVIPPERNAPLDSNDVDEWNQRADWEGYLLPTTDPTIDPALERHTWADAFDRHNTYDFVDDLYADPYDDNQLSDNEWVVYRSPYGDNHATNNDNNSFQNTANATAEANLLKLCDMAKAPGKEITIYGITLNMSSGSSARTLIEDCATSADTFFNVNDNNLNDLPELFEEIARQIVALRLTD